MKLLIASLFSLTLLAGFLAAILLSFMYYFDLIDVQLLFGLTIAINLLLWLLGPTISDWIYRYFYKMRWMTLEELAGTSPASAAVIRRVCEKYRFRIPRLGIIPDKNPNAFTYGSGRWNGRIVITEGILKYLDENERSSVYAHELGHIKNRDFIVMTIASTLLQLLYEAFVVSRVVAGGKGKKGGLPLLVVMVAAYILYWIGQYVVLYLSRVREYYADEFSARETDADHLSSALIKISYGILVNPDDVRLVNSTRFIGLTNFKLSEQIGLVYYNCRNLNRFEPLLRTLLYDLKNPWAVVTELSSTHPLTGKRLRRLAGFSKNPLFDFRVIEKEFPVDQGRMNRNFIRDVAVTILPTAVTVAFPILYLVALYEGYLDLSIGLFLGGWLLLGGLGTIIRTFYKYPGRKPEPGTVIDLMADMYASPVRGRPVLLNGTLVGRGVPGLIFSEDMMMQDRTGLMFLNYESWLPFFGNLFFGLKKVPQLVNREARISGWFLRGISPVLGLRSLETGGEKIRGYVKFSGLILGGILAGAGAVILFIL